MTVVGYGGQNWEGQGLPSTRAGALRTVQPDRRKGLKKMDLYIYKHDHWDNRDLVSSISIRTGIQQGARTTRDRAK